MLIPSGHIYSLQAWLSSPLRHPLVPHTVAKTLFPLKETMEFHAFPNSGANQMYFSF